MIALLSDIHANLEALFAVLDDAEQQGVEVIYNLGDVVGFGPNPVECLDLTRDFQVNLLGNFDQAVFDPADYFPETLRNSLVWQRDQLLEAGKWGNGQSLTGYLQGFESQFEDDEALYVHGSPRNPLYEYVVPEDIYNPKKLNKIGEHFADLCFCGHTHLPGIFRNFGITEWQYLEPKEFLDGYVLQHQKLICNVGSVGQPRDGDPRACYGLYDGERFWIRRVEYDYEVTIQQMRNRPNWANILPDRLREGR